MIKLKRHQNFKKDKYITRLFCYLKKIQNLNVNLKSKYELIGLTEIMYLDSPKNYSLNLHLCIRSISQMRDIK